MSQVAGALIIIFIYRKYFSYCYKELKKRSLRKERAYVLDWNGAVDIGAIAQHVQKFRSR